MHGSTKILGLFGVLAACGPGAPQGSGGSSSGGDDSSGSGPGTSGEPTEPGTSGPPTTTTPPPECDSYDDCAEFYCGYCSQGVCTEGVGCCGGVQAPQAMHMGRCSPPYDCYEDEDCLVGEFCESGSCIPGVPGQLPACPDVEVKVAQWKLSVAPSAFVLADLDADGDLDLAAAQPSVAQIEVALGDGAGNFTLAGAFGVGGPTGVLWLAAGDLDDDGDNDLAVIRGDTQGGLILAFGQDAVFVPQPVLATDPEPGAVFIQKLDDDELEDVMILGPGAVTVRLGTPQADFAAPFVALGDTVDPRATLFDINGGGRLDLIGSITDTTSVGVWTGKGDGGFLPLLGIDTLMDQVAAFGADLDTVKPDNLAALVLVRTLDEHGRIDVWNATDAPQMFDAPVPFATSVPIAGATLVELEAPDGPDLLAATGRQSVVVAVGDGVGGFACERLLQLDTSPEQRLLVGGDVDGDGRGDILVGEFNSPTVTVLRMP